MKHILLFPVRIVVLVLSAFILFTDYRQRWLVMLGVTFGVTASTSKARDAAEQYSSEFCRELCLSPEEINRMDNAKVLTWRNFKDGKKEQPYVNKILSVKDWASIYTPPQYHSLHPCLRDGKGAPVRNRYSHLSTTDVTSIKPMIQKRTSVYTPVTQHLDLLERYGCLTDLGEY